MKRALLFTLIVIAINMNSFAQSNDSTELSKDQLIAIFGKYQKAQENVFRSGSAVSDVDDLYSFYTDDFEYNHPKYGGIYSRELLYNNTVKYLKKGAYNNTPKSSVVKMIVGLNAIVVEEKTENESETTMTLFKFRNDKIYYIEEYW